MNRIIALLLPATLVGCSNPEEEEPPASGTQIGFEEQLECRELSREVLTNLDETPDGFEASPNDSITGLTGSFSGFALDEMEEPTTEALTATVSQATGDTVLIRYEVVDDGRGVTGTEVGAYCPDRIEVPVEASFLSDEVDWAGTITLRLDLEGSAYGVSEGDAGFGSMPEPLTFDPAEMDGVEPQITFSCITDLCYIYVSHEAFKSDGGGEDGGDSLINETVVWGSLDRQ